MFKKLLTLIAVSAAFTASAEVIFQGEHTLTWSTGLTVDAENFASAQAGNVVVATFNVTGAWGNLDFCANVDGWPKLANNDSRSNVTAAATGDYYTPDVTSSQVVLAASDIENLKTGGLALNGNQVTVTKLELLGEAPAEPSGSNVWTGNFNGGNWSNLEIPASYTKGLAAGDKISIYFTVGSADDYGKVILKDGAWNELTALQGTLTNVDAYGAFQKDVTSSVCTLSAADASALSAGFIITAYNVTITKVVFGEDTGGSDTPSTPSGNNVWTGNFDGGNWGNLEIPASYTKGLAAGDKISIYFTVGSDDDYGKVILKDGAWAELADLQATLTNVDAYGAFQKDVTTSVCTLNAADAAALAANGFIITAYNVTITKVVFGEAAGGDDTPSVPSGNNVWTGNFEGGNWTNLEIPVSYTKNLIAGDKISIYFTVGSADDYGKVILKDGDWAELAALQATLTNVDAYGAYQKDVTSSVCTLNAADAASVATTGFIITAYNVTITKVVFGEESSSVADLSVDNANAPVEYYNLQGVRIIEPAAGNIYIRRQGNDVKKIRF